MQQRREHPAATMWQRAGYSRLNVTLSRLFPATKTDFSHIGTEPPAAGTTTM